MATPETLEAIRASLGDLPERLAAVLVGELSLNARVCLDGLMLLMDVADRGRLRIRYVKRNILMLLPARPKAVVDQRYARRDEKCDHGEAEHDLEEKKKQRAGVGRTTLGSTGANVCRPSRVVASHASKHTRNVGAIKDGSNLQRPPVNCV